MSLRGNKKFYELPHLKGKDLLLPLENGTKNQIKNQTKIWQHHSLAATSLNDLEDQINLEK